VNSTSRPLTGTRVVDLSRLLPGNYCTLILALLGAEVIKVEDRGAGDYIRQYGTQVDGAGAVHHMVNRGKKSIALDLRKDEDRELFDELVRRSHILVESFRPGALERLGYSKQRLAELRSDLVVVSISGFGQDGPLANKPAHDINFLAFAGLLERTGERNRPPVVPPIPLVDLLAGLYPALMAVAFRAQAIQTGIGATIDTAMAEAIALLPTSVMAEILAGAPVGGRGDFRLGGGRANYEVYEALDGYIAVAAQEVPFWRNLCEVASLGSLVERQMDPDAQEEIHGRLAQFFGARTRNEIAELFGTHDACVFPVDSYEEMLQSEQAIARGYVTKAADSSMPILAFPVVVDGNRLSTDLPAPSHGEHSEEIVRWLRGN
jgi:alpha-methylacyl-CoA racemase